MIIVLILGFAAEPVGQLFGGCLEIVPHSMEQIAGALRRRTAGQRVEPNGCKGSVPAPRTFDWNLSEIRDEPPEIVGWQRRRLGRKSKGVTSPAQSCDAQQEPQLRFVG